MNDNCFDIKHSIRIDAPVEVVWSFLTDSQHVPQWLGCMQYKHETGHVFYMQQDGEKRANGDISGATHCEVLALDQPVRFSFSWFFPGTPKTRVTFELAPFENGTEVCFLHEGWEQFEPEEIGPVRTALAEGWCSFVLPGLMKLVHSADSSS